jgi:hypothetical protein
MLGSLSLWIGKPMPGSRLFALLALILLGFSAAALADDAPAQPPFAWPPAFAASWERKCKEGDFTETYRLDGMRGRMDTKSDKASYSMIFDNDKREATMLMGGHAQIISYDTLKLKTSGPPHPPFPTDGAWKNLGEDKVNGKPAMKYEVTPKESLPVFDIWLSADGKTPLRIREVNNEIAILSY